MTFNEFDNIIKIFKDTFKNNFYSKHQIDLLFEKVSQLTKFEFAEVIKKALLYHNSLPPISKILEIAEPALKSSYARMQRERIEAAKDNPCEMCDNSGWVDTIDTCDPHKRYTAFACTCVIGKEYTRYNHKTEKYVQEWNEVLLGQRYLASYVVFRKTGQKSKAYHEKEADTESMIKVSKILGKEINRHDSDGLLDTYNNFLKLPHDQKEKVLVKIMKNDLSPIFF